MQLNAASRPANLEVVEVEEADTRNPDSHSMQFVESIARRSADEAVQHVPRSGEPIPIWRGVVGAKIRIVRLDDQVRQRVVKVLENDVNVVIGLPLRTSDSSNDFINVKFLVADTGIPAKATMRRDGIESGDGRLNRGVQLNTPGIAIGQALYVRTGESTTRSERRTPG